MLYFCGRTAPGRHRAFLDASCGPLGHWLFMGGVGVGALLFRAFLRALWLGRTAGETCFSFQLSARSAVRARPAVITCDACGACPHMLPAVLAIWSHWTVCLFHLLVPFICVRTLLICATLSHALSGINLKVCRRNPSKSIPT